MDVYARYLEVANIISYLECARNDTTCGDLINQLDELIDKYQAEMDELEPKVQEEIEQEKKEQEFEFQRSVL